MTEREELKALIKRRLNSYRELNAERLQLLDELKQLERLMLSPSSPNLDGMPKGGSGPSNPVENTVVKHLTFLERYKAKVEDMVAQQAEIEAMIECLDPTERRLARFRYIDGMTWEDVCEAINYSWMQTHRIHARLLNKLVDAEMAKRNQ
jgi:DNA-directed RNA polymerase specialized sigma24 family protein